MTGTRSDRLNQGYMHDVFFQGTSNGIKNLYQKAKDMTEEHGKKASFEKVSV